MSENTRFENFKVETQGICYQVSQAVSDTCFYAGGCRRVDCRVTIIDIKSQVI